MKRFIFVIPLIPFCISCIWDRDTLADDGEGRIEAAKTIVGWFDRNPPEYYEMRLERVLKELESQPNNLELYDDAAVALDRLHRSNEAINLIKKKEHALTNLNGKIDESVIWEHQYRYLANIGTFYAHRWIGKSKTERISDLSDLKKAEEFISATIKHNPDAHFGREHFQLEIIKWLQSVPEPSRWAEFPIPGNSLGRQIKNQPVIDKEDSEIVGLLGMVQLGAAWESVDIYKNISHLLQAEGRSALARAASLRVTELQSEGKHSLHPQEIEEQIRPSFLEEDIKSRVENWYQQTKKAADDRHQQRLSYMDTRFSRGEHPDTHSDFWAAWKEPEFPKFPGVPPLSSHLNIPKVFSYPPFFLAVLIAIGLWVRSYFKRRHT